MSVVNVAYFLKLDALEKRLDEAIVIQQREAAAALDRLRILKQHVAQARAGLVVSNPDLKAFAANGEAA